jgi:general secretion pathway protein G
MARRPAHAARPAAFTLVEVLIVVVILGILAALVVPQFSNAADVARGSAMRDQLRHLRTQVMVYRVEHRGVAPGYPGGNVTQTPTAEAFVNQMTGITNAAGQVGDSHGGAYRFGPYLNRVPVNPVDGVGTITLVGPGALPEAPTGDGGWLYQPSTGTIVANVDGTDAEGVRFFDY